MRAGSVVPRRLPTLKQNYTYHSCWTIGCCAACLARMQPKLCEAVHAERPPKLLDPRDLQRDAVLAVGAHMPSFLGGLPLLEHEHSWRAMDSGRPGRTTSQPSFTPMPWLMAVHVAVAVRSVRQLPLCLTPSSSCSQHLLLSTLSECRSGGDCDVGGMGCSLRVGNKGGPRLGSSCWTR